MNHEEIVLCGSSAYTRKFYLNEDFNGLPEGIKEELKILCVLYTEDIGGTLQMIFDEDGSLTFKTDCEENDFLYDEIGSVLKIKQIQRKQNCWNPLRCTIRYSSLVKNSWMRRNSYVISS